MKSIAIGVHLRREDVEPLADAVPVTGLFLSAMAVAKDQPLSDRDLLVRVAAVRAALLERAIFVAIRYGFAFRDAGEAESKCAVHATSWKSVLEENRTRVEFTLKVVAKGASRPDRRGFASGAEYLRALQGARDAATIPEALRSAAERHLVPLAVRHRWLKRDSTSLEFAGLIERERLAELSGAGEAVKREAPDVPFLLSAPWPLEVFAEEDQP